MKVWETIKGIFSKREHISYNEVIKLINSIDGGVNITPVSALSSASVYAVISRKTSTLATLPIKFYTKSKNGRKEIDHDQKKLLTQKPNNINTAFTFWRAFFANYELWGDGMAEIRRNGGGRPVAYYLMLPYEWEVTVKGGEIFYKHLKTGRVLDSMEVLHISDFNNDGLRGLSKITLHKEGIGIDVGAVKVGKSLYNKGTFLGGYIKYPNILTGDQLKKYRETFTDLYSGVDNAGRIGALDGGAEFVPFKLTMPLSDLAYIESRKLQREEIAMIFNYPIEFLSSDNPNSSTMLESIMINYVQSGLLPIVVMLEQELNNKVFKTTEQNNYIKIELKGLLRGDTKARAEYYDKMFKVAAISPNEIRALEDEEPIEGGDNYFVAVNNLMPLKMVEDHFKNEKNKQNGVD